MKNKFKVPYVAGMFGVIALLASGFVSGASNERSTEPLRVCSAKSELPYSDEHQGGFENHLAEIVATRLHRHVEHVWWTDPRYYVRDLLEAGKCDLAIGVDSGDPRLLTTRPYYRTGYAFIYRADSHLNIDSWESPDIKKAKIILVVPNTPAETMLRKIGRYAEMMRHIYAVVNYRSPRNQYVRFDPDKMVDEVISGKADVAVLWAPEAARYVKSAKVPLKFVLPPDKSHEPGTPPLFYSTSMGVRKSDAKLAHALDEALSRSGPDITGVLRSEGIPTVPVSERKSPGASVSDMMPPNAKVGLGEIKKQFNNGAINVSIQKG